MITSPLALVPRAIQVCGLIESLMNFARCRRPTGRSRRLGDCSAHSRIPNRQGRSHRRWRGMSSTGTAWSWGDDRIEQGYPDVAPQPHECRWMPVTLRAGSCRSVSAWCIARMKPVRHFW